MHYIYIYIDVESGWDASCIYCSRRSGPNGAGGETPVPRSGCRKHLLQLTSATAISSHRSTMELVELSLFRPAGKSLLPWWRSLAELDGRIWWQNLTISFYHIYIYIFDGNIIYLYDLWTTRKNLPETQSIPEYPLHSHCLPSASHCHIMLLIPCDFSDSLRFCLEFGSASSINTSPVWPRSISFRLRPKAAFSSSCVVQRLDIWRFCNMFKVYLMVFVCVCYWCYCLFTCFTKRNWENVASCSCPARAGGAPPTKLKHSITVLTIDTVCHSI